jgi:hypothetical protein
MSLISELENLTVLDRRRITAARRAELMPSNHTADNLLKMEALKKIAASGRAISYDALMAQARVVRKTNLAKTVKVSGGRRSADGTGGSGLSLFWSAFERAAIAEIAAPLISTEAQRALSRAWRAKDA